jgi:hypothetical protein
MTRARYLMEGAVDLIESYIQTNLPGALDAQSAYYTDGINLENPREYFIYPKSKGLQPPCVFVIGDALDFKISENKSNFVNGEDRINVSIVAEDTDETRLTRKVYRYQAALHQVLDEAEIISLDSQLKIVVVVYNAAFSDIYMRKETTGDGGNFRKEVSLQCRVAHFENF